MTWPVALHPGVDNRLERLILPDEALAGGLLITPPESLRPLAGAGPCS